MPSLGVNIDHVASIRQLRKQIAPEPVFAAVLCERAGADSIVAHLREDRRHINDADIQMLRMAIRTSFNLEMSINPEIVKIACKVKPNQATLVPEKRQEITTEGGLDAVGNFSAIIKAVNSLSRAGIHVSLFIDPEKQQIDAAHRMGVRLIELHTGRYANATNAKQEMRFLTEIKSAARYACAKNIRVAAGHGLDYNNVRKIAAIKEIEELNIGYAIICQAVLVGIEKAVREMKSLIQ